MASREDSKHYKKKRKVLENTEESYEKKPRLTGERWNSSQHTLLPIKDSTGIIQQITQLSQNGKIFLIYSMLVVLMHLTQLLLCFLNNLINSFPENAFYNYFILVMLDD